jgi:hypothetical protein
MNLLDTQEAHVSEVTFAHRRKARALDRLAAAQAEVAASDDQLSRALDGLTAWLEANPPDQTEMFPVHAA